MPNKEPCKRWTCDEHEVFTEHKSNNVIDLLLCMIIVIALLKNVLLDHQNPKKDLEIWKNIRQYSSLLQPEEVALAVLDKKLATLQKISTLVLM